MSAEGWDVPSGWCWTTMGAIADVVGGGTPRRSERSYFEPPEVPWITPADLSGYREKFIERGRVSLSELGLRSSAAKLLPTGTVLFSSRAPIGYVAIARRPLATNQGFRSFIVPSELDPEYVYYYLQRAKPLAIARASGTTFLEISGSKAATIPICIASLPEQRRIVSGIESYFTRLDDATATLERVQRNLERYRASVLKAAVEGRLVPTEAELARQEGRDYEPASVLLERILVERRRRWEEAELGKLRAKGKEPTGGGWKQRYKEPAEPDTSGLPDLPEGWCWASVGQLGQVCGGLTKNPKRESAPKSAPYLRVANVYADELRLDDVKRIGVFSHEVDEGRLCRGDLLVVEGNGSPDQIGRVALWDGSIQPCYHQNHLIRVRLPDLVCPAWPLTWLLSPRGRGIITSVASSTSGLHTLSVSKIASLPVPLAPFAEQVRCVDEVARRRSISEACSYSVSGSRARCGRLRQSILKWAFEGKLVDQDPTDEPASELLERIRSVRNLETRKRGTGASLASKNTVS